MTWPFVSRRAYDQVEKRCESYQTLAIAANTRAAAAETRYHALAERLLERAQPAIPTPQRNDLAEAIQYRAGNDPALRRHLGQYAAHQKRDKVDETEIINAILHWDGDKDEEAT